MKAKKTTLEEPANIDFMRRRNTSFSKNISCPRYSLHLQRKLSKIMEVKGLKLSTSFSNKSLPKSKIIWRLNSLALNVQCKTFQFFKAGEIFSKFIFLLLTFSTQEACLVWYSSRMTDETKSKKPKYDFPCKTKINANSYCKKDVKASVK